MTQITLRDSPPVSNADLNHLFNAAWNRQEGSDFQAVLRHCLVCLCAYEGDRLAGFVKVIGDGGVHGFLLDTTVHPDFQRRGIGLMLLRKAAEEALARGIEWLHVDYEPHLAEFYRQGGF